MINAEPDMAFREYNISSVDARKEEQDGDLAADYVKRVEEKKHVNTATVQTFQTGCLPDHGPLSSLRTSQPFDRAIHHPNAQ